MQEKEKRITIIKIENQSTQNNTDNYRYIGDFVTYEMQYNNKRDDYLYLKIKWKMKDTVHKNKEDCIEICKY